MKRLGKFAVVVLGALASVTAAQAGATTTIINSSTAISGSLFVSCANGGLGELVDLTGTIHNVFRTTVNGDRFSETFEGNYQGVTGVGETSADAYVGDGAGHDTFNGSFTNSQATETFTEHFNAIGQGSAPNLRITEFAHITVNASGDVTVTIDKFSGDCG
jgi:hypothetical protein